MVIQAAPVYARHFHLRTLIDPLNTSERKEHKPVNGPPPKKTLFSETPLWLQGFLCISQLLTPPNWMLEHTKWNTKGCEGRHHSFEAWTSVDKRSYSQKHQGKYGMFSLPSEMYSIWFHTNVISPQSYEDKTFRSRSFLTSENSPLMCFHSEGLYV